MAVDPRAVLSGLVRKHSNVPPDMVSKDRLLGQFFLVCYCVCLHVSPVCPGSAGQSLFAMFSRGRYFSGLDLLASCQGPWSDPYMGEENTSQFS